MENACSSEKCGTELLEAPPRGSALAPSTVYSAVSRPWTYSAMEVQLQSETFKLFLKENARQGEGAGGQCDLVADSPGFQSGKDFAKAFSENMFGGGLSQSCALAFLCDDKINLSVTMDLSPPWCFLSMVRLQTLVSLSADTCL